MTAEACISVIIWIKNQVNWRNIKRGSSKAINHEKTKLFMLIVRYLINLSCINKKQTKIKYVFHQNYF